MVRKVQLHDVEELLVGFTRESRPALALGDPPLAFSDGAHWSQPLPWLRLMRPADLCCWWPQSTSARMRATRWRYVSKSFPPLKERNSAVRTGNSSSSDVAQERRVPWPRAQTRAPESSY